jgi:hypothetical protein
MLLDTSLLSNRLTMDLLHKEVLNSSIFEAFLESVPQLILQSSIVLRTGTMSKHILRGHLGTRNNFVSRDSNRSHSISVAQSNFVV